MRRQGLPQWCSEFRDRHGKWRVRARRKGYPTYYFKALAGTEEFGNEYRRWLAGEVATKEPTRSAAGTIDALVERFYTSAEWKGWAPETQRTFGNIMQRLRASHGAKRVSNLQREHVRAIVAEKAATPFAANNLLKVIRALMRFAVAEGWRRDDPTIGVPKVKARTAGIHSWSEDEISAFEARWPVGTTQRLAMSLMLFSGQRRSDVVKMGRQHVRDGRISVVQQKTGTALSIPLHPALVAVIEATPSEHLTFLTTRHGRPYTSAGFTNWFREACVAAGLAHCSGHGLRKAAARRLAEAGCTANEIAAVTGHKSLAEVARYTRAADQARLADAAMQAVRQPKHGTEIG